MNQALLFETPHQLCDFIRVHISSSRTKASTPYQLFHISGGAEPQIVLANFKLKSNTSVAPATQAQIKLRDRTLFVNGSERKILNTLSTNNLIECVQLQPSVTQSHSGPVYFWVKKPQLVAEIFLQSVHLNNDRIQYGSIESPNSKQIETIVKIDTPSFFLIQHCLEDYPDDVAIYYPDSPHLFIRWNYQHPLRDWWPKIEPAAKNWCFFEPNNHILNVEPINWQDAYDLTRLSLNFNSAQLSTTTSSKPPQFEVRLKLTPNATNQPTPELWLLDQTGLKQLEATIQLSDQDSLANWQVAVQNIEGDPAEYVFIRELIKGSIPSHYDYTGTAFARYRGLNNLLIPINCELQPPLRRDAYRELFQLKAGFITLLLPRDNDFHIVTINENHFKPITSYIDYLIEQDHSVMDSLLAKTRFDFQHYLKAPANINLGTSDNQTIPLQETILASPATTKKTTKEQPVNNTTEPPEENNIPSDRNISKLEQVEIDLEREIVNSGANVDLWQQLLVCKTQLNKPEDALLASIESLWLAPQEESFVKHTEQIAKQILDVPAESVTINDHEWIRRAAVFATVLTPPKSHEVDQWISDTTHFIRNLEPGLRTKDRWLAWSRILTINQDERKENQLREEIRNRITNRGLSLDETPVFIRNRIFRDRKLNHSDSEHEQDSFSEALDNLIAIEKNMNHFKAPRLKKVAAAIMARVYSQIGDHHSSLNLIQDQTNTEKVAKAWVTMFELEALNEVDESLSKIKLRTLETLLNKADTHTKNAITQIQQTYKERKEAYNPAAFLSQKNHDRTYPRGPLNQNGKLHKLNTQLIEQIQKGDERKSVNLMRELMTLKDTSEYSDYIKLPQVVETIVSGIERFKWGDQGGTLAGLFDLFSDTVYRHVARPDNHFYGSILHSNLALGLLAIDRTEKADQQIKMAESLICDPNVEELDFIDAAAALVKTIEQLIIPLRREKLTTLIQQIKSRFDTDTQNPYLIKESLFEIVVRLIDQICEAAVSRDRLSLQQFKNYQLQDEFVILQRIQSESFINKKHS